MEKIKKKTVIKILISLIAIIAVIVSVLTIPSAECDYKVFGGDYKYHLYDKYMFSLASLISDYNYVYDKKTDHYTDYYPYYNNDLDSDGLAFSFHAEDNFEMLDKNIRFDGRKIYITFTTVEYNGKNIDITFEGTKIFADVYSWKMVKNELFPINDGNVCTVLDLEFAEN